MSILAKYAIFDENFKKFIFYEIYKIFINSFICILNMYLTKYRGGEADGCAARA